MRILKNKMFICSGCESNRLFHTRKVLAALMETRETINGNARQQKETDKKIKEISKRSGDFTNRFGEVVNKKTVT